MTSEMIERVAKAIFNSEGFRWPSDRGEPEGDAYTWDCALPDELAEYREKAKAAIEAMLEPTKAMCRAAAMHSPSPMEKQKVYERAWRDMIHEALK